MAEKSLGAGAWAVLALTAEGPTHGFAVAKALGSDGEIGRVWSLSRPLVYRALDELVEAGLVEKGAVEPSDRVRTEIDPATAPDAAVWAGG